MTILSHRVQSKGIISRTSNAGCEDCVSPEQDHPEFLLQKNQEGQSGAHDAVLDYADLFSHSLRNDDVQELDTRWDELFVINEQSSCR